MKKSDLELSWKEMFSFTIIALLIFIGFAVMVSIIIYAFFKGLSSLIPLVKTEANIALISVILGFLLSLITYTGGQVFQHRMTILQQNREKKIPVYEKYIGFILDVAYKKPKKGKEPTVDEIIDFMSENLPQMMIWGAEDVCLSYMNLFKKAGEKNSPEDIMCSLEDFVKAIRKDLGHKDQKLKKGDLLALFVTDIDKLINK